MPQRRSGRAEKSRPHRDTIPDPQAPSQSLYRLSQLVGYKVIYLFIYSLICGLLKESLSISRYRQTAFNDRTVHE